MMINCVPSGDHMGRAALCLLGDYSTTETIFQQTANPIYYYDDGYGLRSPNYTTGWGEIEALAAFQAALEACERVYLPVVYR